ncbi:hypothetical protein, partial [Castellaniella defragrans]
MSRSVEMRRRPGRLSPWSWLPGLPGRLPGLLPGLSRRPGRLPGRLPWRLLGVLWLLGLGWLPGLAAGAAASGLAPAA